MGERLVVNITSNGELLANAYYHWSGYTESAAEITKQIVKSFEKCRKNAARLIFGMFPKPEDLEQRIEKINAYLLLEETGAGIEEIDEDELKHMIPNYNYRNGNNRNEGLIAISKKNMKSSNNIAEETVNIDIASQQVEFKAFVIYLKDEIEEEEEEADIVKLSINDVAFFHFSEIEAWSRELSTMCANTNYTFYQDWDNPDIYYRVLA